MTPKPDCRAARQAVRRWAENCQDEHVSLRRLWLRGVADDGPAGYRVGTGDLPHPARSAADADVCRMAAGTDD